MSLNDEELQKLKELDPDLFSLIALLSGVKIPPGEIGETLEQINKNIENQLRNLQSTLNKKELLQIVNNIVIKEILRKLSSRLDQMKRY